MPPGGDRAETLLPGRALSFRLMLQRIGGNHDEKILGEIGLYNNFPRSPAVPSLDNPTALYDVTAVACCFMEHTPQIQLCKVPVRHAFQHVWTQVPLCRTADGPSPTFS